MQEILSAVDAELFGVWFLIGAALVFWMQAGVARGEPGFTRAKKYIVNLSQAMLRMPRAGRKKLKR